MNHQLYNEIANTRLFEMEEAALFSHARLFLSHYRELADEEKRNRPERPFLLAASTGFSEKIYMGNAGSIARWEDLDDTDVVVNVIRFSGPIMRNGGACAYGSKELRDMIVRAADVKQCIGQIFIADTPGGSSYSKFDFKEALDYAHAKGQMTAIYVDGMLASAGMAWGALCGKRYAHSEHCLMGCMGTYGCLYTNKDGDTNSVTQEKFNIKYATASPMKNRAYRDLSEGDDRLFQEEVDKSDAQYKEIIRAGIPNVTAEQLEGGMWEAGEVIGTLCDGIRTFDEVVDEMLAAKGLRREGGEAPGGRLTDSAASEGTSLREEATGRDEPDDGPDKPEEPEDPEEPGDPNEPVDPNKPDDGDDGDDGGKGPGKQSKNNRDMGKKYENIRAVLGTEVLESGKDNSLWLHEELADKLEAFIVEAGQEHNALFAKVDEVKQLTESVRTLKEGHAAEIERLKAEHESALELAGQEASAKAESEKGQLQRQVEELAMERDSLKAAVEEKEKEIAELSEKPAGQLHPGTGTGQAEGAAMLPSRFNCAKEQREAKAKFVSELRKRL